LKVYPGIAIRIPAIKNNNTGSPFGKESFFEKSMRAAINDKV